MGAGKRMLKFGGGSLLGAAVGTAVAMLWAPQSGDEMKGRWTDRLRLARLAGAEAQAAKEEELIRKFRADVSDPEALQDEVVKVQLQASEAVAAIGLGLNAPGAIAAQDPSWRAAAPAASNPAFDVATLPADVRADQAMLSGAVRDGSGTDSATVVTSSKGVWHDHEDEKTSASS
jgi:gas vesicle protein